VKISENMSEGRSACESAGMNCFRAGLKYMFTHSPIESKRQVKCKMFSQETGIYNLQLRYKNC